MKCQFLYIITSAFSSPEHWTLPGLLLRIWKREWFFFSDQSKTWIFHIDWWQQCVTKFLTWLDNCFSWVLKRIWQGSQQLLNNIMYPLLYQQCILHFKKKKCKKFVKSLIAHFFSNFLGGAYFFFFKSQVLKLCIYSFLPRYQFNIWPLSK